LTVYEHLAADGSRFMFMFPSVYMFKPSFCLQTSESEVKA